MNRIVCGDALTVLRRLKPESVDCCVTSPPYWGLRDYGTAKWEGGDANCGHSRFLGGNGAASAKQVSSAGTQQYEFRDTCQKCGARRIDAQLGLERTPEEYVSRMVEVFREVKRVLKAEGTLWLNLGDSYARMQEGNVPQSKNLVVQPPLMAGRVKNAGLKPKDLVGIPWRVAFALQTDGWYLRSDIIWHKPNPMPESVTDRPTKAHEHLFLLAKSERYFYDADAIREKTGRECDRASFDAVKQAGTWHSAGIFRHNGALKTQPRLTHPSGRNRRTVWTVTTRPFKGAHFATFPEKLIEPCILAGCPQGGTVLDPFFGAGTTGVTAKRLNRNCIGIELNPAYVDMAKERQAA